MMAPVCNRFIQNAWKKDMCSNCFRSKIEHAPPENNIIKVPKLNRPIKGIIRSSTKQTHKNRTVSFSPEPVQIIGQGGEDWSDDEGVPEDISSGSSEDDCAFNEEDKEIEKITKYNTDYNTNLLISNSTEKRRNFTQLMLGKPQIGADGNKQTLLVSVTPFGQEEIKETHKKNNRSHIPIAKNKDLVGDKTQNVVLTSYVKNKKDSNATINLTCDKSERQNTDNKNVNTCETKKTDALESKEEKNCDLQITETGCIELSKSVDIELQNIVPEESISEELNCTENKDECEENNTENFINSGSNSGSNTDCLVEDYEILDINESKSDNVITSTVNRELVKSRTELTIQLVSAPDEINKEENKEVVEISEDCDLFILPQESREQAGEPDGRADPDIINEPPALPLTPPPPLVNPRISFLHSSPKNSVRSKPKVPSKPEKIMQLFKKVNDLPPLPPVGYIHDVNKTPNKRRAPNPPPSPVIDSVPSMIRCSSFPENMPPDTLILPEPAPRKVLSLSHEDLLTEIDKSEDKRRDKPRAKFSLKKFLRVGGNSKHTESKKQEKDQDVEKAKVPQVKPRLVIVHPLELNGHPVEVMRQEDIKTDTIPPAPPPRNLPPERVAADIKLLSPPPKSDELLKKQIQVQQAPAVTVSHEIQLKEYKSKNFVINYCIYTYMYDHTTGNCSYF